MSQAKEEFKLTSSLEEEFCSTSFNDESTLQSLRAKNSQESPTSRIRPISCLKDEFTSSLPGTEEVHRTPPNTEDLVEESSEEENSELFSSLLSLRAIASSQDLCDSSPPRALFWSSPFGANPENSPFSFEKRGKKSKFPRDENFIISSSSDVECESPPRKKFASKYRLIMEMPSTSTGLINDKNMTRDESSDIDEVNITKYDSSDNDEENKPKSYNAGGKN